MPRHLPIEVEAIENWLNRINANGQDNERFLKLKICDDVPNLGEMFEHLKEVYYFFCKIIALHYFCAQEGLDSLNFSPSSIYNNAADK